MPAKTVHMDYTTDGVRYWREGKLGGKDLCFQRVIEWGSHEEFKYCPKCGKSHSRHDPVLCHACAFGLG